MSIEPCAKCGFQMDTDYCDPYIGGVPYCVCCAAEMDDGAPSTPREIARAEIEIDAELVLNAMERLKEQWDGGNRNLFSLKVLLLLSDADGILDQMQQSVVDLRRFRSPPALRIVDRTHAPTHSEAT